MNTLHPPDRARVVRSGRIGLLLGATLLLVAACAAGGGNDPGVATLTDPSASPAASASPSLSPQDAMLAFAKCMRDHGIDMPDPQFNDSGGGGSVTIGKPATGGTAPSEADRKKFTDAQDACGHFLNDASMADGGGQIDQATEDAMLAYAQCMRDHGVDMPDPQFNGGKVTMQFGGPGASNGPQFDPNSKTFKDADAACKSKLPGGGKGGPGTNVGGSDGGSVGTGPGNDVVIEPNGAKP